MYIQIAEIVSSAVYNKLITKIPSFWSGLTFLNTDLELSQQILFMKVNLIRGE